MIRYKDKVKIVRGFYEGCYGVVLEVSGEMGVTMDVYYDVKLPDTKIVRINSVDIVKVEA